MNAENHTRAGGGLTLVARILVVVEAACLVLMCLMLNNILPFKYLGIVIAVAVLLLALQILLVAGKRGMKGRSIVSILLSVALIGFSVFVIVFMHRTESKLAEMTVNGTPETIIAGGQSTQSKTVRSVSKMNVYVRKADHYSDLNQLQDKTFGVLGMMDRTNTNRVLSQLEGDYGQKPQTEEYAGILPLSNALRDAEVDAILVNAGYASTITDNDSTFNDWADLLVTIDITRAAEDEAEVIEEEETAAAPAVEPVEDVTIQPFLVYLTGMDTRGDMIVADVGNSDVNMVIAVNPQTKRILMVNIPRDYYYYLWGDQSYPDKITHCGYYGVDCSIQTMNSLFGIGLNYYVKVGFNSVINIVDALGGITVNSPYEFELEGVYISEGENYLDGYSALQFARERESLPGGDRARGMDQQEVIRAIIQKVTSSELITHFNDVLGAVTSNVVTNIQVSDMEAILKMQLDDGASWDIQTMQCDGYGDWQYCYSLGDANDVMIPEWSTVEAAQAAIYSVLEGA